MSAVLQVDIAGTPQEWISPFDAATLICSGNVSWTTGEIVDVLHGGRSRFSGERSVLEIPAIVATKGMARINLLDVRPALTRHNDKLFLRDRYVCAYCAETFRADVLTREHIVPVSKGGADDWMNVVTACRDCNSMKADRTPEQAKMPLVYLPYVPNRYEDFLLRRGGKHIIADQMAFLLEKIPKHSRLHG